MAYHAAEVPRPLAMACPDDWVEAVTYFLFISVLSMGALIELALQAPLGYENDSGFHYGIDPR